MELAECKQCVVGIILPKWLGHFGSSLNHQISKDLKRVSHFRSVFLLPAMASSSLDATSLVASADVVSVASLPEAMEVDAPPSTVDSELLSESSFQLVGDLAEITNEDYQMAEQVAEAYKNDEDATSLTLSGVNPGSFTMLQTATKVDLQKLLTELTEAMQRMLTKDSSVDQGTGTQPGPAVSGQGMGTDTKALVEFEKVTVDTYRIANGNLELPLVPPASPQHASGLHSE